MGPDNVALTSSYKVLHADINRRESIKSDIFTQRSQQFSCEYSINTEWMLHCDEWVGAMIK